MCTLCLAKGRRFLLKHEAESCPFQTTLYCSTCACYGHSFDKCPAPIPLVYTKVVPKKVCKPIEKPLLELVDNETILKSFLQSKRRMPTKAVKSADLRKLVALYATEMGYELNLVSW
jgi:hypothetical protein